MAKQNEHICIKENELGKIVAILERIVKEFYGNGNEGIAKTIPRLEIHINNLTTVSSAQATAISALAKAVTEITAIGDYKRERETMSWKKAGIIISSIIGTASIITSLIFKLL